MRSTLVRQYRVKIPFDVPKNNEKVSVLSELSKFQLVTTYPAIFGQVVAALRKSCRDNQQEFAKKAGMSQSTLSRIERGESPPTIDQLFQISKTSKTKPSKILDAVDKLVEEAENNKGIFISNEDEIKKLVAGSAFIAGTALGSILLAGFAISEIFDELGIFDDD